MKVIRLNLSKIRYVASFTVPHFPVQGERGISTVWDGIIDEPKRLGVNGRHNLCKTVGNVTIFYTDPGNAENQSDEEDNERPSGYLRYFDFQDDESDRECGFEVFVCIREKYIWDFYLERICNSGINKGVVLRIQVEGLTVGWEPDGSGSEWEDASEPLWIKGFTFENQD